MNQSRSTKDGEVGKYRETSCAIENLLTRRLTPEVSYLCARAGATQPYRGAVDRVGELCGIGQLTHMRVRRETMRIGEHSEEEQFRVAWFEGRHKRGGPRFGLAIDSTVLPANIFLETSKIEVIAGRVDCDGRMGRRFACAANRRSPTRMLVAAALRQEGWRSIHEIDVVNDGAKGMRSLVTDVAPRVAEPMLDWFHLAMKLHAIRSALFANTFERLPG